MNYTFGPQGCCPVFHYYMDVWKEAKMASTAGSRTSPPSITSSRTRGGFDWFNRLRRSESFVGYLFISPWLIGFLVFGLWPLLNMFYDSLTSYNLFQSPQWIGFKNYTDIFTNDPIFRQACVNM